MTALNLTTDKEGLDACRTLKKYVMEQFGTKVCKEPTQHCAICQSRTLISYLNWLDDNMWQIDLNEQL